MNGKFITKDIRTWALVMTAALTFVGAIQFLIWHHVRTATIFWIIAVIFLVPGLLFPTVLRPIFKLWLKFAAALAWVNTRLVLSLVYYLVFTPVGLLLRLLHKDLIKQNWNDGATTYWIDRPEQPFDKSNYEKQY